MEIFEISTLKNSTSRKGDLENGSIFASPLGGGVPTDLSQMKKKNLKSAKREYRHLSILRVNFLFQS